MSPHTSRPRDAKKPVARSSKLWLEAGHAILLLKTTGKAPLGSLHRQGFKDATTDIDVLREWVRQSPSANYGIVPAEGIVVIDIDPRAGGDDNWKSLLDQHGPVPNTARTLTSAHNGVRGQHIYLRAPDLTTGKGELAPGVEYKVGPCGYLVGPGSIHPSGERYEADGSPDEIGEAPAWLIERIEQKGNEPLPAREGPTDWTVPIGKRHDQITSLAGSLCRIGFSPPDEVEGALLVLAPRFEDTDGLLRSKIRKVAKEAQKWAEGRAVEGDENQAQTVVRIGRERLTFGVDQAGQAFAVPKGGSSRIAIPATSGAIRDDLILAYHEEKGGPPSANAITSALGVFTAEARRKERSELYLRTARKGKRLVLDLGWPSGEVVVIHKGRWRIASSSPDWAVFRRTELTGAMPRPIPHGGLDALREVVNVTDRSWELLVAWMVCVMLSDVPVPILTITGEQGAGKSTLGRIVTQLLDPSPSPLRQPPSNPNDWVTAAYGSRVVGIDNLSRISEWLSDAMCRAVTGEGHVTRKLFTDGDLTVISFQRALLLTSIDPGAMRGDLANRLLPIELTPPTTQQRRSERSLATKLERSMPAILGGLLDLTATVLDNPVKLMERPRMADAAEVMAAVDAALGTNSLAAFLDAQDGLADVILDSDPVAGAIVRLLESRQRPAWKGSPTELLAALSVHAGPMGTQKGWPRSPRSLSQRLTRLAPALRDRQIDVTKGTQGQSRSIELRHRSDS